MLKSKAPAITGAYFCWLCTHRSFFTPFRHLGENLVDCHKFGFKLLFVFFQVLALLGFANKPPPCAMATTIIPVMMGVMPWFTAIAMSAVMFPMMHFDLLDLIEIEFMR